MLRLNLERLAIQVVRADMASYLRSKLKLEQEEGLKARTAGRSKRCSYSAKECAWVREREKLLSNSFELNLTKLVLTA